MRRRRNGWWAGGARAHIVASDDVEVAHRIRELDAIVLARIVVLVADVDKDQPRRLPAAVEEGQQGLVGEADLRAAGGERRRETEGRGARARASRRPRRARTMQLPSYRTFAGALLSSATSPEM